MYEDHIRTELKQSNEEAIAPQLAAGDVIIWSANLLHGSPICEDNSLSRRSQVTHYHFSETEMFYNPSFSKIHEQKFVRRNVEFIPT
jgi:ectoine hydroxylase-related dioxygenase (phytanoyl-CoA dioxygenase family)